MRAPSCLEKALEDAASSGDVATLQEILNSSRAFKLLGLPLRAPRANFNNGKACVAAAGKGHAATLAMLLNWPEHAPRADCMDGLALVEAAYAGHTEIVRMLLEWPEHAPRADCMDGLALVEAAHAGHTEIVRMLLEWPEHAPKSKEGVAMAFCGAAFRDHVNVLVVLVDVCPEWIKTDILLDTAARLAQNQNGDCSALRYIRFLVAQVDRARRLGTSS
jgi:hypothetical protein